MLTLPEAKEQLNIDPSDTSQEAELQGYIDAVESVVERQTGEVVTPRTVTETHVARCQRSIVLDSIPVIEVASVARADGARSWSSDDLLVDSTIGVVTSTTAPFDGRLVFTVQAGRQEIPPNYRLAALIILQHLWRVQRGSGSAGLGGPSYADGMAGFAVPRRAAELLGSAMGGVA